VGVFFVVVVFVVGCGGLGVLLFCGVGCVGSGGLVCGWGVFVWVFSCVDGLRRCSLLMVARRPVSAC